jgi:hypothetical protein
LARRQEWNISLYCLSNYEVFKLESGGVLR